MFRVYQINLTDEDIDVVNSGQESDVFEVKRMLSLYPNRFDISHATYYDAVYDIDSDNLDECFEIANLWNQNTRVKLIKERVASMSVGDLIENTETGRLFIVDNFGFKEVA